MYIKGLVKQYEKGIQKGDVTSFLVHLKKIGPNISLLGDNKLY
jgi:hypothetical protein